MYTDCACVKPATASDNTSLSAASKLLGGITLPGSCPIDCSKKFIIFLAVVCLLKFSGSSGRASNFLLSVR